jgi:ubiquinone/menaquinone biosynthesis C-methylase UbiE
MNDARAAADNSFPETADIETASDGYAARFAGPTGAWMLAVQERVTMALLSSAAGTRVLDVGGGHGQLALPLCRAGCKVTVVGSAESCRRRIDSVVTAGQCGFVVANVLALPFAERSFGSALCFRLLTHCTAWPKLVAELCRVAAQSVIVDYPTGQSLNSVAPLLFGAKKRIEKNTRAWRLFTHAEIRRAFESNGFTLEREVGQFFLPMVLHRALHSPTVSRLLEGGCRAMGLVKLFGSPVIAKMARR